MAGNKFESGIPEELKEYVSYRYGSFPVKNKNRNVEPLFRFSSQDVACAAAKLFIKHDWNLGYVKEDPMSEYNDEYYVFKIIDSKIIFDSKFGSFESAVEYLEINSRSIDNNNDIVPTKKRKSKYDNKIESITENKQIPNIFSENDKFVVKKSSNGKKYGIFDSIDEAIVAKQLLIKNNWKLKDSAELEFYNSYYWVFLMDVKLIFIDKFESYEDALDCLDSLKVNISDTRFDSFTKGIKVMDDEYIDNIKKESYVTNNNFEKSISDELAISNILLGAISSKPGYKAKKSKNVNLISDEEKQEIIRNSIKIKKLDDDFDESIVDKFETLESELKIIEFNDNNLKEYYTITPSSNGDIEFSSNLFEFDGFEYILKFLNFHNLDLNNISFSSSIHYFNDHYYIIKVFDDKLVISGLFDSYEDAESNIGFLYDYYSKSLENEEYPHNVEHYGRYFRLDEEHNGKTFELSEFTSVEDLKSVVDIFEYFNWNPEVFKENDLFYYKGMYWDIKYFYYDINLSGRFDSKKDALDYKSK